MQELPRASSPVRSPEQPAPVPQEGRLAELGHELHVWWLTKYVAPIDHPAVVQHVREEGRVTSRYSFMVVMSAAIAVLGLLQSSPAVVIGAMLISPLMGPIISLGFSLTLLDFSQMKKALEGLVVGVALALLVAWMVVTFSPLTEATPEILARTQPNLFDLLVAVFSGLAGGYAVIKRKGEGIVGVAIATALMPPLAVMGYGLAVHNNAIASGAFMLFMTNLLAIALSVTLLAKFYGFGTQHSGKHTVWQLVLITVVFSVLSLPLGVALKDIAGNAYQTKTAKALVDGYFDARQGRVSSFQLRRMPDGALRVDVVALTPDYQPDAQSTLQADMVKALGGEVSLEIDQVVMAKAEMKQLQTAPAEMPRQAQSLGVQQALLQGVGLPVLAVQQDDAKNELTVVAQPSPGVGLEAWLGLEETLQARQPEKVVKVVPPYQPLPAVPFAPGEAALGAEGQDRLEMLKWALQRWGVAKVDVVGRAASQGDAGRLAGSRLAAARAEAVAAWLRGKGLEATASGNYGGSAQRPDERLLGEALFQRADVRLPQPNP